jgi:tetratricopeptide (TPR) repeat protein
LGWWLAAATAQENLPPPAERHELAELAGLLDAPAVDWQDVARRLQHAVHADAARTWGHTALDAFVGTLRTRAADVPARVYLEHSIALAYHDQGRLDHARAGLQQFVRRMDAHHALLGRIRCRVLLAELARTQGDLETAIAVLRPVQDVDRAALLASTVAQGDAPAPRADPMRRNTLVALAEAHGAWSDILRSQGRFRGASEHLDISDELARAANDANQLANCRQREAEILLASGDPQQAQRRLVTWLDAAAKASAERGSAPPGGEVDLRLLLSTAQVMLGDIPKARAGLAALARDGLSAQHAAEVAVRGLDWALVEKDWPAAREYLRQCRGLRLVGESQTGRRVAAFAATLARLAPTDADEQARCATAVQAAFAQQLVEWRRLPPDPGGFGFLQQSWQRLLLSEVVHLRLRERPDDAEHAIVPLLATQACGALARARNAPTTDVAAVRAHVLAPGGGILVYLPARPQSHLFAITSTQVRHWHLDGEDELAAACRPLHNRLVGLAQVDARAARELAPALRTELDAAGAALLPDALRRELGRWQHLSVVGADLLGDLTFEALPLTADGDSPLLGEALPTELIPSLPWAVACRQATDMARPARGPWLSVLACTDPEPAPAGIVPFRLTPRHVDFVRAFAGEQFLVGAKATCAAADALDPMPVTQVLAHEAGPDDELHRGVALRDGTWRGVAIARTVRPGGLCVLSVCRAGGTELRPGEGLALTSLGGAVLAGGAHAIVQSRDHVLLDENLALLRVFYGALDADAPPSVALQRARVAGAAGASLVRRVRNAQFQLWGLGQRAIRRADHHPR